MSDIQEKNRVAAERFCSTPREMDRYMRGRIHKEEELRIAAFGAIRRAAKVARELDAIADAWWDDPDDFTDPVWMEGQSLAIRDAIRAAIGSEKQN